MLSLQIPTGGFTCSSFYTQYSKSSGYDLPHIVFSYSGSFRDNVAVNVLSMVGGVERVDKDRCLESVGRCQKENGSFSNFSNSE